MAKKADGENKLLGGVTLGGYEKPKISRGLEKSLMYIKNTKRYMSLRKVVKIALSKCKNSDDVMEVVNACYIFHEGIAYRWPTYFLSPSYCHLMENTITRMIREKVVKVTGKKIEPNRLLCWRVLI